MKILSPKGYKVRPTSSKVRAAVLNSLQTVLPGASFVDVFAGTGAVGLEALSRGARQALFIEQDAQIAKLLKMNIEQLVERYASNHSEAPQIEILTGDIFKLVNKLSKNWDIVWMDPPYQQEQAFWPRMEILLSQWLLAGTRVVIESNRRSAPELTAAFQTQRWQMMREKTYGDTLVWIGEKS